LRVEVTEGDEANNTQRELSLMYSFRLALPVFFLKLFFFGINSNTTRRQAFPFPDIRRARIIIREKDYKFYLAGEFISGRVPNNASKLIIIYHEKMFNICKTILCSECCSKLWRLFKELQRG